MKKTKLQYSVILFLFILCFSACNSGPKSVKLHFVPEINCFQSIAITGDMVKNVISEHEFGDSKLIVFEKTGEENIHCAVTYKNVIFDLGAVAGEVYSDSVTLSEADLYGEPLIKISGSFGAAYSRTDYYSVGETDGNLTVNLVLHLENYNNYEADFDGDGVSEVAEFSGGAAYIHKYMNDSFYIADLIADTGAVSMNCENGVLSAYYEGGSTPVYYSLENNSLAEVRTA